MHDGEGLIANADGFFMPVAKDQFASAMGKAEVLNCFMRNLSGEPPGAMILLDRCFLCGFPAPILAGMRPEPTPPKSSV